MQLTDPHLSWSLSTNGRRPRVAVSMNKAAHLITIWRIRWSGSTQVWVPNSVKRPSMICMRGRFGACCVQMQPEWWELAFFRVLRLITSRVWTFLTLIQWSYIPSVCTLIQWFGRGARTHLLEATAIYVVEPKYLDGHTKRSIQPSKSIHWNKHKGYRNIRGHLSIPLLPLSLTMSICIPHGLHTYPTTSIPLRPPCNNWRSSISRYSTIRSTWSQPRLMPCNYHRPHWDRVTWPYGTLRWSSDFHIWKAWY
jgi:hypothetical protein